MRPCISSRGAARLASAGLLLALCAALGAPAAVASGEKRPKRQPPEWSSSQVDSFRGQNAAPVADSLRDASGDVSSGSEPSDLDLPRDKHGASDLPGLTHRLLRRKTRAYDLVKMGENVHVGPDEVVRGDVVILGGNLRVEGEVTGDAVVIGGDIESGPEAIIGGEAVAVGGRVDASPGATVRGGVVSLSFLPAAFLHGFDWSRAHQVASLIADVLKLGFLLLSAVLLLLFFPARLTRAAGFLGASFLKCFGIGILALTGGMFAVVVAAVLFAITLVGIPMAILLACLCVLLLIASLIVGALLIGDRVREALRIQSRTPLVNASLGLVTLLMPELVADALRFAVAGPLPASFLLHLFYAGIILATLAGGLGALVLSKLGSQEASPTLTPHPLGGLRYAGEPGRAPLEPPGGYANPLGPPPPGGP